MAWDIETYSSRKTGEVPSAEHDEDNVFMICLTIHWLHESEALYKICLVDKETESDSRWITIVCNTEINILKAMAICWNHFKPDIFIGYNDSGYDWPFIVEKAERYDILSWMWQKMSAQYQYNQSTENIIKRHYNDKRRREIKINAEKTFYSQCLMVPGTISIDCLPCFMKIYPRLETNKYGTLKFYLQDNQLPTKVDLPIPILWKYYESGNVYNMREIAYYCIVDTISVQRLFVKRNIITDYREVSTLAYVSLADSHYYAGGVKVCNLLGSYAWDSNILVNMKPKIHAKAEYPGAYVFPPDKGMTPNLNRLKDLIDNPDKELAIANFAMDRPVSCLDFASLYPSLIMTYNLSPEKILVNKDDYIKYKDIYKLHDIDFDVGNRRVQAWSILHENKLECMGLFPTILKNLFAKRKEMKGLLKKCSDKKELYELIFSKTTSSTQYSEVITTIINDFERDILDLTKEITFIPPGSTIEEEIIVRNKRKKNIQDMINIIKTFNVNSLQNDYENVCFERNCIDKKQGALKIYMNTFYGETGNHLSPFFLLQLAGGVTSAGQANIKLAANYAKDHGFGIKYGDSVMPYTPITIKINGQLRIVTISSFDDTIWNEYPEFKRGDNDRYEKEYLCINAKIWTHQGWAPIKKLIRHRTIKKIYRVITTTGIIDVTEDHSLLDLRGKAIKPAECVPGMRLLHSNPMVDIMDREVGTIASTQLDAQLTCIALQSRGYKVSLKYANNMYYTNVHELFVPEPDFVRNVYLLHEAYDGYVYDVETEYGTFHAGVGNLIVKNTDSLYLTCPNKYFLECDNKFISGEFTKEEFYTAMVKISLRVIANFENEINEFLKQNNGTDFLKMENEGCNFPCLFLGKKKYFGIQHLSDVNFKPKKLYIKGIEIIKQGKSGLEKEIGNSIMKQAVSIENELDIMEIVKNILFDSVNSNRWKFEDFIQTSAWKPKKDNKSVQSFMKRMNARHDIELKENEILISKGLEPKELYYTPLEPGERFSYVIVKNDILYDLQGRKINIKVGDIMEYAHIAKKENMQIDVVYYLIHYVIGICARFISSNKQFMPPEDKLVTMDDKKLDEYSIKMAKKMLEDYVKNLSGISKKDIIEKGKECKILFKNALQICTKNMSYTSQNIVKGPLLKMAFADEEESEIDIIFRSAAKYANTIYKKINKNYCDELCLLSNINSSSGEDIGNLNSSLNLYKWLQLNKNINYSSINRIEYELRKQLNDLELVDISIKYKTDLMYIIDKLKQDCEINIPSYDLTEFTKIWYQIIGLELYKLQNKKFIEYLDEIKCKRNKIVKKPSREEIKQSVEDIITKNK